MRTLIGASAISRVAGVMITVWLWSMGPAWAGGGGSDGGINQPFLQEVCGLVGVAPGACPLMPTLTQIVLGIANYQNTAPDYVRSQQTTLGSSAPCSVSGTPFPLCSGSHAVTTVNPLAPSSIAPSDLSNLTPLAFRAVSGQPVTPVALGSQSANSWIYPVLTGPDGQHTLEVVFDYGPWKATNFVNNNPVGIGSFTFPLVILNAVNSETSVVAKLQLTATCGGAIASAQACVAGTVTGVGNKPLSAAQLGIKFSLQLAASPNLSTPHLIATFQLPVIVTGPADPKNCGIMLGNGTPDPADCGTDPAYFGVIPAGATLSDGSANPNVGFPTFINQLSGQSTAFTKDDRGFTPTSVVLPNGGVSIGYAPYAAPLCSDPNCAATPTFYGFCAAIADKPAAVSLTPAAATFASIGTDGTTYASSPVDTQPKCP